MPDTPPAHAPWLIRSGAFGDMVMLTAACQAAADRHGHPCVVVGTGHWNQAVFDRCPAVLRAITLDSMKTPRLLNPQKRNAIALLKATQPEHVYICGGDQGSHDLVDNAQIPADRQTALRSVPALVNEHQIDHLLRLIDPSRVGLSPRLVLSDADRLDRQAWLSAHGLSADGYILVQAGNKKTMKRGARDRASNVKHWPEERWQATLSALHERHPDKRLIICGTEQERAIGDDIAAHLPAGSWLNASGDLPIGRLLALAEQAFAMLSVDTGPAHAAAAMGCPMCVIFGSTDPRLYAPRGSGPCAIAHALGDDLGDGREWWQDHHSMEQVQVDHVLAAWQQMLDGGS